MVNIKVLPLMGTKVQSAYTSEVELCIFQMYM